MANKNKLLSILSDAEQEALYGLPDFDDAQRLEALALDESELALACSRRGLHAQMYCILQIAYFKAKHLFFRFGRLQRCPEPFVSRGVTAGQITY